MRPRSKGEGFAPATAFANFMGSMSSFDAGSVVTYSTAKSSSVSIAKIFALNTWPLIVVIEVDFCPATPWATVSTRPFPITVPTVCVGALLQPVEFICTTPKRSRGARSWFENNVKQRKDRHAKSNSVFGVSLNRSRLVFASKSVGVFSRKFVH